MMNWPKATIIAAFLLASAELIETDKWGWIIAFFVFGGWSIFVDVDPIEIDDECEERLDAMDEEIDALKRQVANLRLTSER